MIEAVDFDGLSYRMYLVLKTMPCRCQYGKEWRRGSDVRLDPEKMCPRCQVVEEYERKHPKQPP